MSYEDFLWNGFAAEATALGALIARQISRMRNVEIPTLAIEGIVNQPCISNNITHVLKVTFKIHEREVACTIIQCDTIPELVEPLTIARYATITNAYMNLVIVKQLLHSCLTLTSSESLPMLEDKDLYPLGEFA